MGRVNDDAHLVESVDAFTPSVDEPLNGFSLRRPAAVLRGVSLVGASYTACQVTERQVFERVEAESLPEPPAPSTMDTDLAAFG